MPINKIVQKVTDNIQKRSEDSRASYLNQISANFKGIGYRNNLSCGNLAHGFAGCNKTDKDAISKGQLPNIGLISAYNDMLSAHKPYENYPALLRGFANEFNATLQMAGGTPAMCDGVTQGQPGMDLSLLSRDIIALSTAIALSHDMFDGAASLGICDKIVPGLLIGNLGFGHLPSIFIPSGPMTTGISNDEKAKIRRDFAEGKISRDELLKGESDSYHSPGTCTFYGTANSNQMLMEIMGLQLPGSSFVNPQTEMRTALSRESIRYLIKKINENKIENTIGYQFDVKKIVNGIIGLLATGGSTNHTLHLVAIAKAAGIHITWNDFSELSEAIPLICRIYPNGPADINHFHAAGGMALVIRNLLDNKLLHEDVRTVMGFGMNDFTKEPKLIKGEIIYQDGPSISLNNSIIRNCDEPFAKTGGLKVLNGNLGTAVIKTSAVESKYLHIEEEAIVFDSQEELQEAFKKGELNKNFVAVIPFQGPSQKGMPELHNLTPPLTILQKKGFRVALLTDGRMSGASGKVPAVIHVSPEAAKGGLIGLIRSGDKISIDVLAGKFKCMATDIESRTEREVAYETNSHGRSLFSRIRSLSGSSEEGASIF